VQERTPLQPNEIEHGISIGAERHVYAVLFRALIRDDANSKFLIPNS